MPTPPPSDIEQVLLSNVIDGLGWALLNIANLSTHIHDFLLLLFLLQILRLVAPVNIPQILCHQQPSPPLTHIFRNSIFLYLLAALASIFQFTTQNYQSIYRFFPGNAFLVFRKIIKLTYSEIVS